MRELVSEMGAGELSTLTKARPGSDSLRTTVPIGVAKQFKLNEGDQLDWTIEARDGKLIIIVTPHKGKK